MLARRTIQTLVLTTAIVAVLAGCGRKGDLDTPYQASIDAQREAERNKQPVPPAKEPPVADKPFILDGLIE